MRLRGRGGFHRQIPQIVHEPCGLRPRRKARPVTVDKIQPHAPVQIAQHQLPDAELVEEDGHIDDAERLMLSVALLLQSPECVLEAPIECVLGCRQRSAGSDNRLGAGASRPIQHPRARLLVRDRHVLQPRRHEPHQLEHDRLDTVRPDVAPDQLRAPRWEGVLRFAFGIMRRKYLRALLRCPQQVGFLFGDEQLRHHGARPAVNRLRRHRKPRLALWLRRRRR